MQRPRRRAERAKCEQAMVERGLEKTVEKEGDLRFLTGEEETYDIEDVEVWRRL